MIFQHFTGFKDSEFGILKHFQIVLNGILSLFFSYFRTLFPILNKYKILKCELLYSNL
jgi:hypothetical protein